MSPDPHPRTTGFTNPSSRRHDHDRPDPHGRRTDQLGGVRGPRVGVPAARRPGARRDERHRAGRHRARPRRLPAGRSRPAGQRPGRPPPHRHRRLHTVRAAPRRSRTPRRAGPAAARVLRSPRRGHGAVGRHRTRRIRLATRARPGGLEPAARATSTASQPPPPSTASSRCFIRTSAPSWRPEPT